MVDAELRAVVLEAFYARTTLVVGDILQPAALAAREVIGATEDLARTPNAVTFASQDVERVERRRIGGSTATSRSSAR